MASVIAPRWMFAVVLLCSSCACFSPLFSPPLRRAAGQLPASGWQQIAQSAHKVVGTLRMTQQPDDQDDSQPNKHHFFDWTKNADGACFKINQPLKLDHIKAKMTIDPANTKKNQTITVNITVHLSAASRRRLEEEQYLSDIHVLGKEDEEATEKAIEEAFKEAFDKLAPCPEAYEREREFIENWQRREIFALEKLYHQKNYPIPRPFLDSEVLDPRTAENPKLKTFLEQLYTFSCDPRVEGILEAEEEKRLWGGEPDTENHHS